MQQSIINAIDFVPKKGEIKPKKKVGIFINMLYIIFGFSLLCVVFLVSIVLSPFLFLMFLVYWFIPFNFKKSDKKTLVNKRLNYQDVLDFDYKRDVMGIKN